MTPTQFDAWLADAKRPPLLMGVLNATPDSFSDGGELSDTQTIERVAIEMAARGAAVLDVGGESTRPGADPVSADEQIARVVPAILAARSAGCVISVDTASAKVAAAALDAGASMINDISAGRYDEQMFALAAERRVPIAIMHMQGQPRTMQDEPRYVDVVSEVYDFLATRASAAVAAGVARHRVIVDVGIGFGKSLQHNLLLLKHHARIADLGYATLPGHEPKRLHRQTDRRRAARRPRHRDGRDRRLGRCQRSTPAPCA